MAAKNEGLSYSMRLLVELSIEPMSFHECQQFVYLMSHPGDDPCNCPRGWWSDPLCGSSFYGSGKHGILDQYCKKIYGKFYTLNEPLPADGKLELHSKTKSYKLNVARKNREFKAKQDKAGYCPCCGDCLMYCRLTSDGLAHNISMSMSCETDCKGRVWTVDGRLTKLTKEDVNEFYERNRDLEDWEDKSRLLKKFVETGVI